MAIRPIALPVIMLSLEPGIPERLPRPYTPEEIPISPVQILQRVLKRELIRLLKPETGFLQLRQQPALPGITNGITGCIIQFFALGQEIIIHEADTSECLLK